MTTGDLGSLLRELIERWRDARAHTYASENADLYRGFETGQRRCADDLERLLAARPAAPRTPAEKEHEEEKEKADLPQMSQAAHREFPVELSLHDAVGAAAPRTPETKED